MVIEDNVISSELERPIVFCCYFLFLVITN
jgi:hypothetical protein